MDWCIVRYTILARTHIKMPRPVRIGGISMSREDFFKNVLAPGWNTYAVFEKDLAYYVGSSRFGKFFDDSFKITRSCYFKGTEKGCQNKKCKYSHEAPDGVLCKTSPPWATEEEHDTDKHQAYVALYVQMKRQVAKYRLKGVQVPTNTTFEEIIKDVPFGRLLSVETPDGIFTEAATRKENKRKLISSAGITSEDEIAELIKLCPYDLEIALSTRTTPEANAAGGGSTIPVTVPKKDSGTPYADKVKGTTLVKVLKKDGETPYADKVTGKNTSALIKALTTDIPPGARRRGGSRYRSAHRCARGDRWHYADYSRGSEEDARGRNYRWRRPSPPRYH